jgi:Protein of unknown function (DUF4011)
MPLADKLTVWQKDLLDMSRNNNLLYYRAIGRGAGIQLQVDDDLNSIYAKLMENKRPLVATELRPNVEEDDLERRLARLRSRVRDDFNDRGIQTLFMAFGMLEWRETEQSSEIILSPLLLVPVALGRQGFLGAYTLQRLNDEELEVNPTLREKLFHDFHVQLPTFGDIEERFERETAGAGERPNNATKRPLTLDRILNDIGAAMPGQLHGRIRPELHLGRFFFQKLVMYRDLQHNHAKALAHPCCGRWAASRALWRNLKGYPAPPSLMSPCLPMTYLKSLKPTPASKRRFWPPSAAPASCCRDRQAPARARQSPT